MDGVLCVKEGSGSVNALPLEFLYQAKIIDASQLFAHLFSAEGLYDSFLGRYSKGTAKGQYPSPDTTRK